MDFILTAIVFLIIFSILVLIHECGHFFAARSVGIKVEEFGFGMPPRLWGVKKGEVLYSVNLIPFGGFVRLLGEDPGDEKMYNNKRSFVAQSPRARIFVVVAGVLMNLLLAFSLLTFGFSFGIQPLLVSGDEVLEAIDSGLIETEEGVVIKEVVAGSDALEAGLQSGDRIVEIDGIAVMSSAQLVDIDSYGESNSKKLDVQRDGVEKSVTLQKSGSDVLPGFEMYETIFLPRVVIEDVKKDSITALSGLQQGDMLLKINDRPIYFMEDYNNTVIGESVLDYLIYRDGEIKNFRVELPQKRLVVVSNLVPNTPAFLAGVEKGDVILSINSESVSEPEDVVRNVKKGEKNLYEFKRGDRVLSVIIQPDETGLIGVGLAKLISHENVQVTVFSTDAPVSILKINDVVYPFWEAPGKAIEELGKLSVVTFGMFAGLIRSVTTSLIVPVDVSGPVGIAQLTHVFVQEGFLSILRFMALLSLSLAIINIFPFPALDGGRLFFILIEVIVGRRVNPRIESIIHAFGFVLLMALIFLITYNDILKLF